MIAFFHEAFLLTHSTSYFTLQASSLAARKISSAATVLLKNDGTLPLSNNVRNIALIGSEAVSPTTHGGGSGQVTPGYVATPAYSIRNKLGFPSK